MKTILYTITFLFFVLANNLFAQEITIESNNTSIEKYGKTLNAGVGLNYYGYIGRPLFVLHANYEFDVAKNFTLAPFITYYSYQNYAYWGDPRYPYKNYYYRQTVIPIGVKGTYYFDQLLSANKKWDFYLAGSLGIAIRKTRWENGYYGNSSVVKGNSGLYLDVHIGTEYHLNKNVGLFLDLSSGISTFGLAVHH